MERKGDSRHPRRLKLIHALFYQAFRTDAVASNKPRLSAVTGRKQANNCENSVGYTGVFQTQTAPQNPHTLRLRAASAAGPSLYHLGNREA